MRFIGGILLVISSGLVVQSVFAEPLYTFSGVNKTYTNDIPATLGYTFSVNSNFDVTSLGWFDECLDGFQNDHYVALFNQETGQLLTSTTLSAGNAAALDGSFRYQSIAPITLTPGTTYLLAGTTGAEDSYTENDDVCDFAVNPNFNIPANEALFADNTGSSGFVYPTSHFADYVAYAGPNLEGSDAPEPASLVLLSAGMAGLLLLRRRHA
jgi:hypothetical protein